MVFALGAEQGLCGQGPRIYSLDQIEVDGGKHPGVDLTVFVGKQDLDLHRAGTSIEIAGNARYDTLEPAIRVGATGDLCRVALVDVRDIRFWNLHIDLDAAEVLDRNDGSGLGRGR